MIFRGAIVTDRGQSVGSWSAALCRSMEDLYSSFHFGADHFELFERHDLGTAWPLAFLISIRVDEENERRKGSGSLGMRDFLSASRAKGARLAFARVSDPETPSEVLSHFYTKNGWTDISETGLPQSAYLRFAG